MSDDRPTTPDDVKAIVAERNIRFIRLWFTDILGFLKSFAIPAEELQEALTEGVGFDGSSIDGFARVQESDMVAHPDASTFQLLAWRPGPPIGRWWFGRCRSTCPPRRRRRA